MATGNITKRFVDSLVFTPRCDYFVWDTKLKGFGVRVTARLGDDGALHRRKVFVVGYRPRESRQFRRFSLGVFGPVTVEQARDAALQRLSEVTKGGDPLESKRDTRAEPTVRELGTVYIKEVQDRRRVTTASEYKRLWDKNIEPALGAKKVTRVSAEDVRRLHASLRKTPYVANRIVAILGAFFSFTARQGFRPLYDTRARAIELFPEPPRERFLTRDEFRRLGVALAQAERHGLPPAPGHRRKPTSDKTAKHRPKAADAPLRANQFSVAAIRLLALTGCRENEILSLRWHEVDFERGYLRLGHTKTGKSVRPLARSAIAVLEGLPQVEGNPFVLPGAKPGTHLKEIRRVWHAVRFAAGLEDVRLHDLRHSYASVPAGSGESLLVVRSLLGHKRIATTERYAHLADDPVRQAANRTASTIADWLGEPAQELDLVTKPK